MKKFRSPPDWTPKQRHSAYTDKRGGPAACWPWVGGRNKAGYGIFGVDGRCVLAHRAAYEFEHGPLPAGVKVLHDCDNRPCQNPGHLFPGSQADNVADMRAKGRERKAGGEKHGNAKLTNEQALAIYSDPRSQSQIAAAYGVVQTTVSRIKLRKGYRAATGQGIAITVPDRSGA